VSYKTHQEQVTNFDTISLLVVFGKPMVSIGQKSIQFCGFRVIPITRFDENVKLPRRAAVS
jgi:hypothetical protein